MDGEDRIKQVRAGVAPALLCAPVRVRYFLVCPRPTFITSEYMRSDHSSDSFDYSCSLTYSHAP
jgi:hypothetical protein